MMTLRELIQEYWRLAYNEGKEGRDHDTPNGDAQRVWYEIDGHLTDMERAYLTSREAKGDEKPVSDGRCSDCKSNGFSWCAHLERGPVRCKGTNCTSINGRGKHSDECTQEHDALVNVAAQEAAKPVVPPVATMNDARARGIVEPVSTGWVCGWNDCRKAMIAAVQEEAKCIVCDGPNKWDPETGVCRMCQHGESP